MVEKSTSDETAQNGPHMEKTALERGVRRLGGGYNDSVPGDVTKTAPSGDCTT